MNTKSRWYGKANAYAAGWEEVFAVTPDVHAVVLGLAVAQHETGCGDAWPGENNWGAVQLPRKLTDAERTALKGIVPHPNTVDEARAALAGAGIVEPHGALHADSSPGKGYYFIYFARFDTEAEGAAHCVRTLAKNRGSCRRILEAHDGTEYQLAAAMYATRYYEGIYVPDGIYQWDPAKKRWTIAEYPGTPTGETKLGRDLNVEAYAGALLRWTPQIRLALVDWGPGATINDDPAPPDTIDLSTWRGRQAALNFVGSDPTLDVDGDPGTQTRKSLRFFQTAAALAVKDGQWNAATEDAMVACLDMIPGAPRVMSL